MFILLSVLFAGYPGLSANETVKQYWDSGLAEISRYELKQARYGSLNEGEAILLFVTEPFSLETQVKDETGKDPSAERILKLNAIKRFETGIYDYSIMSSVFSSMKKSNAYPTFKSTTSIQDWCGQAFHQWNQRDGSWQSELRSYFQSFGDEDKSLPLVAHEDGIWNRLRTDPLGLPTGDFEMIPATSYLRLKQNETNAYEVNASLAEGARGTSVYTLVYPSLNRSLTIRFESKAPYEILGWSESYPDRGDEVLTTEAKRTHSTRSYYWEKNRPSDTKLRKLLGL